MVDAILHQIELHQREINGDSMPYGLSLILNGLGSGDSPQRPSHCLGCRLSHCCGERTQKIQMWFVKLNQNLFD